MTPLRTLLMSGLVALCATTLVAPASAAKPGQQALEEFRHGHPPKGVVQNKFFHKAKRFEIAPLLGYVPNNPFARRYVGGVAFGYHFTEEYFAQANISYSPDLGEADLKGLTHTLVQIAHDGQGGANFQQPLDKPTLTGMVAFGWSPLYGKINLIGETVLNFDLYGVVGVAMISKVNYFARYDEDAAEGDNFTRLDVGSPKNEIEVGPALGLGLNFFLSGTIALKLDTRMVMYVDNQPQYDTTVDVRQQRLYNNFVASGGIAFFFPKMKERLYDF